MPEGGNPIPPPYVLDLSILTEVARGDAGVTGLLLILDGRGQPLVLPVLAVLILLSFPAPLISVSV